MGRHRRTRTRRQVKKSPGRYTPPKPRSGDVIVWDGITPDGLPFLVVAMPCTDPDCPCGGE